MFTAALFVFMCVVCDLIEGRHLSVYDNCETDYQLTVSFFFKILLSCHFKRLVPVKAVNVN